MNDSRPKILLMGEFAYGTGFDRVARHLLQASINKFEVHMYAIRYTGKPQFVEPGVFLHPYKASNRDRYGTAELGRLVNEVQPDLLVVFYDLTFLRYQLEALRLFPRKIPIIAYPALDGQIFKRRKLISTLKHLHKCIWFTHFAHEQVADALHEQPSLLDRPIPQAVVPHGVDTEAFCPLSTDRLTSRSHARKLVFPELKNPEEAFIVMNGNRAHARKRHDLTLEAFAQYAQNKPAHVYLYLHLSDCSAHLRGHFQSRAEALGISERLLMGPSVEGGPVDDTQLNLFYNATDVGLTTTAGEGWGLVSCEHGAAGVPQIVPRHTSHPEIWAEAALYLHPAPPKGAKTQAVWHHGPIDPAEAAAHLEQLYQNPTLRAEYGHRAYQRMNDPYFSWKRIESVWEAHFLAALPQLALHHA